MRIALETDVQAGWASLLRELGHEVVAVDASPDLVLAADGERVLRLLAPRIGPSVRADHVDGEPRVPGFWLGLLRTLSAPANAPLPPRAPSHLRLGSLDVDLDRGLVSAGARVTPLTALETRLLRHLARARGTWFSRAELERDVWGYAPGVDTRATFVTFYRLRKKLERDPSAPVWLLSERGRGYCLAPDVDEVSETVQARVLIGRSELLGRIEALLARQPVVTLVGPPGVGKSALARAITGRLIANRHVVFVDASAIQSAADLWALTARALGIRSHERAPNLSQIAVRLAALERPLLVLDGLDGCDGALGPQLGLIARRLVTAGGGALVTTRRYLDIRESHHEPVPPLSLDAAVQLYFERAAQGAPSGTFPREDVERLCEALDGLPLAVELAAARAHALGPSAMLLRLASSRGAALERSPDEQSPASSLSLALADVRRALGPAASRLLEGAALLSDGFSSDFVEVFAGPAALHALDELIRHGLVLNQPEPGGGVRHKTLQTVRLFAPAASEALILEVASALALGLESLVTSTRGGAIEAGHALRGLRRERGNALTLARRCLGPDRDLSARLVLACEPVWAVDGPLDEALDISGLLLASQNDLDESRPWSMRGPLLAMRMRLTWAHSRAAASHRHAMDLLGLAPLAPGLELGARLVLAATATDDPATHIERAKALCATPTDRARLARGLGAACFVRGQLVQAIEQLRLAVARYDLLGCALDAVDSRLDLAFCLGNARHHSEAREVLEAARPTTENLDAPALELALLKLNAIVLADEGEYEEATRLFAALEDRATRLGFQGVAATAAFRRGLLVDRAEDALIALREAARHARLGRDDYALGLSLAATLRLEESAARRERVAALAALAVPPLARAMMALADSGTSPEAEDLDMLGRAVLAFCRRFPGARGVGH